MIKELSAAQITNEALLKLRATGARVRRVNNVGAYKKRAYQVEPGWPDIQGYTCQGVVILCEVKKKGDKLKPEQMARLRDCKDCGGIAVVAVQKNDVELIDIGDYLSY